MQRIQILNKLIETSLLSLSLEFVELMLLFPASPPSTQVAIGLPLLSTQGRLLNSNIGFSLLSQAHTVTQYTLTSSQSDTHTVTSLGDFG